MPYARSVCSLCGKFCCGRLLCRAVVNINEVCMKAISYFFLFTFTLRVPYFLLLFSSAFLHPSARGEHRSVLLNTLASRLASLRYTVYSVLYRLFRLLFFTPFSYSYALQRACTFFPLIILFWAVFFLLPLMSVFLIVRRSLHCLLNTTAPPFFTVNTRTQIKFLPSVHYTFYYYS